MEGKLRIVPTHFAPPNLPDAAGYYADLEIATKAFAAPWCGPSESSCQARHFGIPAISNWSVWSAPRIAGPPRS